MTAPEFSVEFDILYNNISSNKAPGITEYEKSIFLTEAQEAIVLDMYSGKFGATFESTEELRSYLSPLIREYTVTPIYDMTTHRYEVHLNKESIGDIIMYKTYESVVIEDERLSCKQSKKKKADVYPVTQDMLYKTENSPFRGANERRVLRLDKDDNCVELISKYPIKSYTVRYIKKPDPIIVNYSDTEGTNVDWGTIDNPIFIDGNNKVATSKLAEHLHRAILTKATSLAKSVWVS